MKTFYAILDKALAVVLMILVVAMVFSISTEILLNAVIQPLASTAIRRLTREAPTSDPAEDAAAREQKTEEKDEGAHPRLLAFLEGTVDRVARISAPVNTISETLLVWVGILGSALAFRLRAHLGVDALVRLYPPKVRLALDYVSTALVGLFSLTVLVIGGWLACADAFEKGSKMPGLEMLNRGWFFLVLPITGVLLLVYCVYHFAHPKPVSLAAPGQEEREDS